MRSTILPCIAALATLPVTLPTARAAGMTAPPDGLTIHKGIFRDSAARPVYVFDYDNMVGMSHCTFACARQFPPVRAAAGAQASGDWTLVLREDGSQQWAYRGKPLYLFVDDKPNAPPAGGKLRHWQVARP